MSLVDDLVIWAKEQDLFLQDLIRRLISKQNLDDCDIQELAIAHLAEHRLEVSSLCLQPLLVNAGSSLPQAVPKVVLKTINEIQNVNGLQAGQTVPFAHSGMTVVYGENGSGKSSITRILKQVCTSRSSEDVLQNIYSDDKTLPSASLKFGSATGADSTLNWKNGENSQSELKQIAVFDSKSAMVHLDKKNTLLYLPTGGEVFEKAVSYIAKVKTLIEQRRQVAVKPNLDVIDNASDAFKFLNSVDDRTDVGALKLKFSWSTQNEARLVEVTQNLIALLGENKAQRILSLGSQIKFLSEIIVDIERIRVLFTDAHIQNWRNDREKLELKTREIEMFANSLIEKIPLGGLSEESWRILFNAAKDFSTKSAYVEKAFPNVEDGSRCVLCQQELSEAARERMILFQEHVSGALFKEKDEASEVIDSRIDEVEKVLVSVLRITENEKDRISEVEENFAKSFNGWLVEIAANLRVYSEFIDGSRAISADLSIRTAEVGLSVSSQIASHVTKVKELEENSNTELILVLEKEKAELENYKNGSKIVDQFVEYSNILKIDKRYLESLGVLNTTGITRAASKSLGQTAKVLFISKVNEELEKLGLGKLKAEMDNSAVAGQIYFQFQISNAKVNYGSIAKVLSEGEFKVLSLAAFLSEINLSDKVSGVIFDDPVTSLDHRYRESIAKRLAEEATVRQVIIFTHEISFLFSLRKASHKAGNTLNTIVTRKWNGIPGNVTGDEPWAIQKCSKRGSDLFEAAQFLKKNLPPTDEEYNQKAGDIYGRLRETWERLVEEVLLAKVVERFSADVKTMSLNSVYVSDDDYIVVYDNMSKCSRYMIGHDDSFSVDVNRPPVDEVIADIQILQKFLTASERKKSEVESRRKKMNEAEKATIG
jgi:energy-coupling factor transporter ATP-binding protein EcfA2